MLNALVIHLASFSVLAFAGVLFAVQALAREVGYAFGRRAAKQADAAPEGVGILVGGMLGLLAFVLALTLSFASARFQVVTALNELIDLSLSQRFAFTNRVPIYLMWTILAGSMLSIGAMKFQFGVAGARQPTLTALLLFMWTGAIILIVDLNRPRLGWIRVDPTPMVWTIQGFGSGTPPAR